MLGQCLGGVVQCDPEEREGLSDGVSHKKQGHPGCCPPGRARYTRSETTPIRPGVQDAGRGRPGAPSNKTSSLKDRFQSCPRHARQPSMVYAIFPWEVICWQGDAIRTGLVECVSGLEVVGGGLQRVVRAGWKRRGRSSSASLSSYESTTATTHRLGNIFSRGPRRAWQSKGRAFAGRRLVRPPSSRGRCRSSSCTLWCCPRA